MAAASSPTRRTRASSATARAQVRLWSTSNWKCVHVLQGHTQGVSDASFSADSLYLASASDDRTIKVGSAGSLTLTLTRILTLTLTLILTAPGWAGRGAVCWRRRRRSAPLSLTLHPSPSP